MKQDGMTAVEAIVALAIFSVLLLILTSLQTQFLAFERQTDLELFDHPQKLAVLERVRRDVHATVAYPSLYQQWVQNQTTLILRISESEVVIWRFGSDSATRTAWINDMPGAEWRASGLPSYEIGAAHGAPSKVGVRLRGFEDDELIFDQIMFPRAR